MRKIVAAFMGVIIMLLAPAALASYPAHLDGNTNYIFCDGNKGTGYYVERSSLSVKQSSPPTYIISVNIVRVPDADMGKTQISDVMTRYFLYKYDAREMYVSAKGSSSYDWQFLNPQGTYAETGIFMPAGEIAFYLAYKLRFYGEKAGYDNSFYNNI